AVAAAAGAALPRQRPARAAWRGVTACFTKPLAIWDSEAYGCFVEANKGDIRRLSQAVTALTTAAARGMSRAFDAPRVGVLGLAVPRGEVTPSEAAAELDLPASSITRHTQALEDAGQVTVVRNPHDARSCLIRPTAAGVAELWGIEEAGVEGFRGGGGGRAPGGGRPPGRP